MNDLNAPLGVDPKSRRNRFAKEEKPEPRRARGTPLLFLLAALLIALNAYTYYSARPTGETLVVRLPESIVAEETDLAEQTTEQSSDVEVVYGEVDGLEPQIASPEDETIEVSPGGPQIITIRDPTAVEIGQPLAQAHLPEPSAVEDSEFGPLPQRAADGRRPADIYARPASGSGGKRIAIVIGGLGLSQTGTQRALEILPPEITLAFAPTGNSLDRWMRVARNKGHEILMQVPMEPFNYPEVNPGPQTLRLASSPETNLENLHWALGRTTNYTGIMNYLGARFASNQDAMTPILDDLGKRGLLYFNDGSGGAPTNLSAAAKRESVPFASGNLVIDVSANADTIRNRLKALEALAEGRGSAIGSGSALELTVQTVADWANEAKKNGFEIVGIAALADDPERAR